MQRDFMRRVILIVALVFAFGLSAQAVEAVRVSLLNDIFSLELPGDWKYEQEDTGVVSVGPEEDAPTQVMFVPPNPLVKGEIAEYAGTFMGILFNQFGGGEITTEEAGEFKGHPNILFHFTIPIEDEVSVEGIVNVVDYKGAAVLMMAISPNALFKEFMDVAAEVMDSYELDEKAMEENREALVEAGKEALEEMKEMLEEIEEEEEEE